jgi:hypothetical protein
VCVADCALEVGGPAAHELVEPDQHEPGRLLRCPAGQGTDLVRHRSDRPLGDEGVDVPLAAVTSARSARRVNPSATRSAVHGPRSTAPRAASDSSPNRAVRVLAIEPDVACGRGTAPVRRGAGASWRQASRCARTAPGGSAAHQPSTKNRHHQMGSLAGPGGVQACPVEYASSIRLTRVMSWSGVPRGGGTAGQPPPRPGTLRLPRSDPPVALTRRVWPTGRQSALFAVAEAK